MMKIIGAVFLLSSAVWYGYLKIRDERRKIAELEELCDLALYIRENIVHYMKPLPEIFASYSGGVLEKNGFLDDCRKFGIRVAWENSSLSLPENCNRAMCDFANSIGSGYRDDEINLCNFTLEQLCKAMQTMREEIAGKEKMYRTIPPLLALSVMLIFI